jgi:hypothetical protein
LEKKKGASPDVGDAHRLPQNPKISENGKEESYERNPGRVPLVFN